MNKVPLTVHGAELLRDELQRLKSVDRPRIIQAIAEARAHGDLKENAEYHAAKEQQSFTEGRIQEVESKLSNAQVIDVIQFENTGKVIFGTTVKLMNSTTNQEVSYKIVGEDEADIKVSKISVLSPIARAMIGKYAGDMISVVTPDGAIEYEIIDVDYI